MRIGDALAMSNFQCIKHAKCNMQGKRTPMIVEHRQ